MFWIVPSKEIINIARLRRMQSNYKGKFQSVVFCVFFFFNEMQHVMYSFSE